MRAYDDESALGIAKNTKISHQVMLYFTYKMLLRWFTAARSMDKHVQAGMIPQNGFAGWGINHRAEW